MIKTFTATPFSLTLSSTELLSSLLGRLRELKEGTINRYPGIASRYAELVTDLGSEDIPVLKTLAEDRYSSSLRLANAEAIETFVSQLKCLVDCAASNNETASVLQEPDAKWVRSSRIPHNEHPDLMYRLLLQPGTCRTYARLDEQAIALCRELRQKTTRFTAALSRITVDSPEAVIDEIRPVLSDAVERQVVECIETWVNNSNDCTGGRTHNRVVSMYERLKAQSEKMELVSWYPNWFEKIGKLVEAKALFGEHDRDLINEFLKVQAALLALGEVEIIKLPGFASEALTEFLYQINETLVALTALVEMRTLFVKGYRDILEFNKG